MPHDDGHAPTWSCSKKVLLARGGESFEAFQWASAKHDYFCSNRLGYREGLTHNFVVGRQSYEHQPAGGLSKASRSKESKNEWYSFVLKLIAVDRINESDQA
jgi:hypothetical protein